MPLRTASNATSLVRRDPVQAGPHEGTIMTDASPPAPDRLRRVRRTRSSSSSSFQRLETGRPQIVEVLHAEVAHRRPIRLCGDASVVEDHDAVANGYGAMMVADEER